MNYLFLVLLYLIFSCGYPDIDTVPNFKDVIVTKEEATDLCKLTYTDKKRLLDCLNSIISED